MAKNLLFIRYVNFKIKLWMSLFHSWSLNDCRLQLTKIDLETSDTLLVKVVRGVSSELTTTHPGIKVLIIWPVFPIAINTFIVYNIIGSREPIKFVSASNSETIDCSVILIVIVLEFHLEARNVVILGAHGPLAPCTSFGRALVDVTVFLIVPV